MTKRESAASPARTTGAGTPDTGRSATTAGRRRVGEAAKQDPALARDVPPDRSQARTILRGIAVSPGVVVGKAYCIHETTITLEAGVLGNEQAVAELARFNEARERTLSDLRVAREKVAVQIGHQEAEIFGSHAAILGDESFANQVGRYILEQRQSAETALQSVLSDYAPVFAAIKSEYLRERMADLRDIARRLHKQLSSTAGTRLDEISGVLIVDELLPSDLIPLDDRDIHGIITQTGGRTSHAAILARSRGIPAVSGIEGLLGTVQTNDTVIVDGHEGIVFVDPDRETEHAYRKLQREFLHLKRELVTNRDRPAISADNQPVELLANVNSRSDAQGAAEFGATGVGLFRTEYLFLAHPNIPDEEEQTDAYRMVIAASPGKIFTIRTVDLGGDKILSYLGNSGESNPFMGWRSIRLCFEYPDFFIGHIRAILRAAAGQEKEIRLLFPMVTTRDEMLRIRRIIKRARQQLDKENIEYGDVRLGLMIEVPAAAIALDTFLDIVDYVSIGSNDLVQYLTAADRDNPKVNHLCQPLNPAVLRLLKSVLETCRRSDKPVTLCGEMAASGRAFVLLFGMGLRSYSMSPAFIPTIKELASHLTEEQAELTLNRALRMKTARQVTRFMDQQLKSIAPDLAILETA